MIIIFILLNLVMIFSAHLVAYRWLRESNFSEQLVTTFLIYVSQVTFSILFLGVVVKNLGLPWIILLNGAISLSIIIGLRKTINQSFRHSYEKILSFSKEIFRAKDFFLYLLVALFITQVVVLLIKIYLLPSHVWDVFAYHLHPVAEWTQQNMIPASIDSPVLRINRNPLGSKLLHFWAFMFANDTRWLELPQFIYGLMMALTSYSLILKITGQKNTALKYAVLIYFIPAILIESRTSQDHLVLNSALLMAALYFINVFYERKHSQIILLFLALGILLGIKINSPQIIFALFLALLAGKGFDKAQVWEFLRSNKTRIGLGLILVFILGSYWFFKTASIFKTYAAVAAKILSVKVLLFTCLLLVIIVLLVKGIKKLRTARYLEKKNTRRIIASVVIITALLGSCGIVKYKDALNTVLLSHESPEIPLFKGAVYDESPAFDLSKKRFFKNILLFPFRIKDIGAYLPYSPSLWKQSGFGVQFFTFGLIAYLITAGLFIAKKEHREGVSGFIFIFSAALLGSYFFYYFSRVNYRMFMFFPVFGIILWAFILWKLDLKTSHPYYMKYIDVLIVVMILFNMAACFYEGNMNRYRWKTLLTVNNPPDRTPNKYSPYLTGEAWQFIDTYIAPQEPIGYIGHKDSWIFPYFDNRLKRKIYHLPTLPGFKLATMENKSDKKKLEFTPLFKKSLKQRRIHFIHINLERYRHRRDKGKDILIEDDDVRRVSKNLYYFK